MKKLATAGGGVLGLIVIFALVLGIGVTLIAAVAGQPEDCVTLPGNGGGGGGGNNQPTGLKHGSVGNGDDKIPKKAVPWINNLATSGKYHYPEWFVAADMYAESSFVSKGSFTQDDNNGTWGLVQINRYEWKHITGGSAPFKPKNIEDPMTHTKYAAKLWDEQIDQIKSYKKDKPKSGAAKTSDLVLLLASHNAGFHGGVENWPNIPGSTKKTYIPRIAKKAKLWGGDIYKGNLGKNTSSASDNFDADNAAMDVTASKKRTYKLPKVKKHVKAAATILGNKYGIKTIGGYRDTGSRDPNGHPAGLATDFMINDIKNGKKTGQKLADDAKSHAKKYNVKYIIYRQKIWQTARKGDGWSKMEDRGSKTANHMDHVHISYTKTGKAPSGDGGGSNDGGKDTNSGGGGGKQQIGKNCPANQKGGSGGDGGGGSKPDPKGEAKKGGVQLDNVWQYYQGDKPWGDVSYGHNALSVSGCGPTTMASVVTTFYPNKPLTPRESAKYFLSHGGRASSGSEHIWQTTDAMQKKYKFKSEHVESPSAASARKGIKKGGLVIISVNSGTPFTSGGHIMMIRGLQGDKFLVGTSSGRGKKGGQNQNYKAFDTGTMNFGPNGSWSMDIITPTGKTGFKKNVKGTA